MLSCAETRNRFGYTRTAAARCAGQPDHFAALHCERHAFVIRTGQVFDFQRDGGVGRQCITRRCIGDGKATAFTGHRLNQLLARQRGNRRTDDMPCVAQHRHGLADLIDLLQMMRDEQEGHAFALQLADAAEQALDLVAVELRGRFVEDDEARAVRQCPRDLHQLPRFHAQIARARIFAHVDLPVIEQLARITAHGAPIDYTAARRLPVNEQILRDAQITDDRRMLINAGDALAPRIAIRDRRRGRAAKTHLAGIGLAQAGEDRHQRRFARTVAPDERMRLAGHHADTDVFQRSRGTEAFGDLKRFDDRLGGRRLAHLTVLPHNALSSTFDFVTSGAGN